MRRVGFSSERGVGEGPCDSALGSPLGVGEAGLDPLPRISLAPLAPPGVLTWVDRVAAPGTI